MEKKIKPEEEVYDCAGVQSMLKISLLQCLGWGGGAEDQLGLLMAVLCTSARNDWCPC